MASGIPRRSGEEIQQAADRLRGQLVHTPLIGDVVLWMAGAVRAPRLKAECLQTGGSLEYRGALHYLLRRLGDLKGVVCAGPPHRLLACARAAEGQRLEFLALCEGEVPKPQKELIQASGGVVKERVASTQVTTTAQETGYHVLPGVEAEDFALGVATLGLELGAELPSDLARVYVAPRELEPAIAAGLAASGHGARVVGVEATADATELQVALLGSTNIQSHAVGIAALGRALADGGVEDACVILSC